MSSKYLLQQSTDKGWWVATEKTNGIVIKFQEHKFNDTQKVTMLEDIPHPDALAIARQIRELTDWLVINHRNIL